MEEIELTYLPKKLSEAVRGSPSKEILDIYIPASSEHPHTRIRKSGDVHEITKKKPLQTADISHQMEITIPLTLEEFTDLSQIKGKRLHKTRYYYIEKGTAFEIDVFLDDLKGLVLVDVEFKSLEARNSFKMPEWCLADVTQEEFLAGGMLAGKKYRDIKDKLMKLGYKPQ